MTAENYDAEEIGIMRRVADQASGRVVRLIPWVCQDDLRQAALEAMWVQHDGWNGNGEFRAYLWPIATTACAREARRRMAPVSGDCWRVKPLKGLRGVEIEDGDLSQPAGQESDVSRAQTSHRVRRRILAVLSKPDAVFLLAYEGGELSAEDAGYAFDMTPDAVRARAYRARKLLRSDPELRALWAGSQ